jgi:Domain of unknown function (DUF1963)
LPAIVLCRRLRHPGDDRAHARSWLGGAPRLGGKPWPRDAGGRPLHFMAQVDLGEIAAAGGVSELPADGALAFFIGAAAPHEGKVIHIPPGSDPGVTVPPDGLPDFEELGGDPAYRGDSLGRRLFPFWPVDVSVIELPPAGAHDDAAEVQHAAIGERFTRRQYNLSASAAFEGSPIAAPPPLWWFAAMEFAAHLREAEADRVPRLTAELQRKLDAERAKLSARRPVGFLANLWTKLRVWREQGRA